MESRESVSERTGIELLIDCKEAARLMGISRALFWRLYSQGKVPEPIRLSARAVRWRRAELCAWVEAGCPKLSEWNKK